MSQVGNKNIDNASGQVVRTDIENTIAAVASNNFGAKDSAGTILPAEFVADSSTTPKKLLIRSTSGNSAAASATFFEVGNLDQDNLGLLSKAGGIMDGALTLSAGAVGSPSLTVGDSTTGLYKRNSDQLGITIAGTQTAFFDADGLSILGQDDLRLYRNSNDRYVAIQAHNSTSNNYTLTLPTTAGSDTQVLSTDGSGGLSWATAVPTGAIFCVAMLAAAPTGYVPCDGASYSTGGIYAALFAAIQHTYGGSGSNFNVPDLRGEFIRGLDNYGGTASSRGARGVDSGRSSVNDVQGSQMQQHSHGGNTNSAGSHSHTASVSDPGHNHRVRVGTSGSGGGNVSDRDSQNPGNFVSNQIENANTGISVTNSTHSGHQHSFSTNNQGGTDNSSENRPRNIAMMYIIKL